MWYIYTFFGKNTLFVVPIKNIYFVKYIQYFFFYYIAPDTLIIIIYLYILFIYLFIYL